MPHTHMNSQRYPNSLLLWPAFGAGTQQWLCLSQPHPALPGSHCDLGRGSASLSPSTTTFRHTSLPAAPPEGLEKAVPGCWSSLGTERATSSPAPAGEKPAAASQRREHIPSVTDLPSARALLHPRLTASSSFRGPLPKPGAGLCTRTFTCVV